MGVLSGECTDAVSTSCAVVSVTWVACDLMSPLDNTSLFSSFSISGISSDIGTMSTRTSSLNVSLLWGRGVSSGVASFLS